MTVSTFPSLNRPISLWHLSPITPKDQAMEDPPWSLLPDDLVDRIIGWLPLSSKLRCMSVCKHWNSLLSSDRFLNYVSNHVGQRAWFLRCSMGGFACAFDPSAGTWHKLCKPLTPGVSVIAAGGSFLCLGSQVFECRVLSVCNPVTRALKHLPKMPRIGLIHKVSMAVERATNAYVIVVTGEDGLGRGNPRNQKLLTEVYDSLSGSWRLAANALPHLNFGSDPGVWCKGIFYCITELPYGLVAFDVRRGVWKEIPVQMPESTASPSLTDYKGELLMVGREVGGTPRRPFTRSVKVWRLELAAMKWEEIERMPDRLCADFLAPSASPSTMVCVGVGDLLCIATHASPLTAVYDLSSKVWRWCPSDPLLPRIRDFHLVGFSFQPRSDAAP